ncbi:hypothetical protein Lal_00006394 [Lupinus albus]|nr:hypothetical protein Lal_00006394 [Lupinus albus]
MLALMLENEVSNKPEKIRTVPGVLFSEAKKVSQEVDWDQTPRFPSIETATMAAQRYVSPSSMSSEENALRMLDRVYRFLDILHEAPLFAHRKAARAGYATLAIGAPWIFRPLQRIISPVLCSCAVLLLLLTGIFQQYLVYQVQKIRLQGYYSFSQKLKYIVRIPFSITAYGTAAMLLVIVWKPYTSFISISAILRIIMVVEAVCAGSFMCVYIGYIHQYNSLNSHPDVLKSLYSPLQPSSSLEVGTMMLAGSLISKWLCYNTNILRLQECLSKYERTVDRSTPQVDLAHLLAARDQELQTLSAEMNQVQTELKLAQSLIAERDSEIQNVQMSNNQYAEENDRLRAILGEWSTRAVKLERALEAERISNLELQRKVSTLRNQLQTPTEATE